MNIQDKDQAGTFPNEAFVLAGGISSRMGTPKGLLELGGVPLLARTFQLVEPLVSRATVIGKPESYQHLGLPAMPDNNFESPSDGRRSKGPLFGIATALAASVREWNLVLACDLPYITRDWLAWLLEKSGTTEAQAIVPRTLHGLEPLAALYRKDCYAVISQALERGVHRVTDALASLKIQIIDESEWRHVDSNGLVLKNMNTPSDYEEARKWWNSRTVR